MQNFALQTKNKKKRKMMKKITKFLSMAVTFATFLFASCGNISGTIEDTTKDNTPTINEVRTVVFTTDSNGLFEFSNKNSNSRTILPDTVNTGSLNFYLIYKDTVNQSLDASVKKITFKADEGTTKKGTFVLQLPLSDYQFTLCAVPTTEVGISDTSTADEIKAAATFIGYANADFRYNDEVSFHMKANSSSTGKGDINITLNHENSWQVPWNYKVTVGLYEIDTDKLIYPATAQELLDTSSGEASINDESFSSTSKKISQGEYNLVVKYNDITHSKTYEYSEKVIVLMNQTSTGTITIPEIIEKPPVAPTNFKAKFKDPKDSTKNDYQVEFTWTDASNNEREFILELKTLSVDDYIKLPAEKSDWESVTGSSELFDRLTFDTSDLKADGSLNKGNQSATFYLELGKRYIARICAKNDAGVSEEWAYLAMADTVENDWQKFDTDVQTINRFRISYTLNGGTFAAADETGSNVTNPPALVHYASQRTDTSESTPKASTTANVILSPDGITTQNWVKDKNGTTIDTATAITLSKDNRYFYNWTEGVEGGTEYSTDVTLEDKPATYIKNINYYAANATVEALIALRTQPTAATYNDQTFAGIKVRTAASSLYTGYNNLDLVANYDTSKQITVEIDDITLYELKPSYFALTFKKDSADLSGSDAIDSNNTKTANDYPDLTLGGTDDAPGKQLEISTGKVDTIIITADTSNVIPITKYNPVTKEIETTDGDYDNMHLTIKTVSNNNVLVNGDRDENGKWTFKVNTWIPGSYLCEITANTSQIPEQTLSYTFTIRISQ